MVTVEMIFPNTSHLILLLLYREAKKHTDKKQIDKTHAASEATQNGFSIPLIEGFGSENGFLVNVYKRCILMTISILNNRLEFRTFVGRSVGFRCFCCQSVCLFIIHMWHLWDNVVVNKHELYMAPNKLCKGKQINSMRCGRQHCFGLNGFLDDLKSMQN